MDSIKKITDLFSKFPGIGKRTAGRFVFYLINQPKEKIDELIVALQELKKSVKLCQNCFNPFEAEGELCEICKNPLRNNQILCIVEKEADLLSIESAGRYKGLYFVLGNPSRLTQLQTRVKTSPPTEIIIALNPTPEGRIISALVERALGSKYKITHLARGIPVGGELEYADEETLESAFEGRK